MKIIATDIGGTGLGTVPLGDESAGDIIIDPPPLPACTRIAQVESAYGAAYVTAFFRGNRNISFSWSVMRNHASQTAAQTFIWSHDAQVPGQCSITVVDDGGVSHVFSSAVITEVTPREWTNTKTVFTYKVVGAIPGSPL